MRPLHALAAATRAACVPHHAAPCAPPMQARRPSLLGSPKLQIGQLLCAAACQDHQHLWQGASRAGRAWHSGSRHKQPPLIQAASRRVPRTQTVKLDRAVAWDVRTAWKPQFFPRTSNVTDVGVEGFTMQFPWTRYPGHHNVRGAAAGMPMQGSLVRQTQHSAVAPACVRRRRALTRC